MCTLMPLLNVYYGSFAQYSPCTMLYYTLLWCYRACFYKGHYLFVTLCTVNLSWIFSNRLSFLGIYYRRSYIIQSQFLRWSRHCAVDGTLCDVILTVLCSVTIAQLSKVQWITWHVTSPPTLQTHFSNCTQFPGYIQSTPIHTDPEKIHVTILCF